MKDESIGNYVDISVIKLVILKKNPVSLLFGCVVNQDLGV